MRVTMSLLVLLAIAIAIAMMLRFRHKGGGLILAVLAPATTRKGPGAALSRSQPEAGA